MPPDLLQGRHAHGRNVGQLAPGRSVIRLVLPGHAARSRLGEYCGQPRSEVECEGLESPSRARSAVSGVPTACPLTPLRCVRGSDYVSIIPLDHEPPIAAQFIGMFLEVRLLDAIAACGISDRELEVSPLDRRQFGHGE